MNTQALIVALSKRASAMRVHASRLEAYPAEQAHVLALVQGFETRIAQLKQEELDEAFPSSRQIVWRECWMKAPAK